MKNNFFILLILLSVVAKAQVGSISFNVYDEFSKKPVSASVIVLATSDTIKGSGNIEVSNVMAGDQSFKIISSGYDVVDLNDISIIPNQNITYSVGLTKSARTIDEVVIQSSRYKSKAESPLSLRTITSEEVQKNAGANRDVSKTILSLPGVGNTATFRNDLFIRGGSSSENKFYIDGIEVPIINHFQTQGASGGPRGLITIDFVKDVDFYSGAFPAKRNGVLSSLFEFNLKNARKDKLGYKAIIGLDDMQWMMDGPISKDQTWSGLFSVRKSNLQLLFKTIGLPFLPSYYDTNIKISKRFSSGDELYFIGLGAVDRFEFNDNAKNTLYNKTIIERLPVAPQWNYTIGAGYRHLANNGNWLLTYSRNMLDNKAKKYYKNIELPENLITDYHSQEIENKFRVDRNFTLEHIKMSAGANINFSSYFSDSYLNLITQGGKVLDEYKTRLNMVHYGLYWQGSKKFYNNNLQLSAGFRLDANTYSKNMNNPLEQFSPRLSMRYRLDKQWYLNFNTGIYYMEPPYTALGFIKNNDLVNQASLKYIKNIQWVGGVEYNGDNSLRLTAEFYHKTYSNYPFSIRNQVTLANLGSDFGVLGNELLDDRGKGTTYGLELLLQKRTQDNFYGIASYTLGYSKFGNAEGSLIPSSWDSRHILSLTAGKYFRKNWNVGARFRLQSGLPQTPYDIDRTALVSVWNVNNGPVYNYALLNTLRGNTVHQLDLRIEKKWIFSKWQLTFYTDIVNVYGSKNPNSLPIIALERDGNDNGVIINPTAPKDQQKYLLNQGEADRSKPLPYFGFIFEF